MIQIMTCRKAQVLSRGIKYYLLPFPINISRLIYGKNIADKDHFPRKYPASPAQLRRHQLPAVSIFIKCPRHHYSNWKIMNWHRRGSVFLNTGWRNLFYSGPMINCLYPKCLPSMHKARQSWLID